MPANLHLARDTSEMVFNAVAAAVQGIAVTDEVLRKAEVFREQLYRALRPGRERYCAPLRELAREGFEGVATELPKGFESVSEYLLDYVQKKQPELWLYEQFVREGFGKFGGAAYASQHRLNHLDECGCTDESEHVEKLLGLQLQSNPRIAQVPTAVMRHIKGLYWA